MVFIKKQFKEEKKEEYAYVLDFLPNGDATKNIREPVAYVIGEKYFTLLLVEVKPGVNLQIFEKVYIGEGLRDKVKSILKRVSIDDLTIIAKSNLEKAIEIIIDNNEKRFVEFFNTAGPLNIRVHKLELLPNVGKSVLNNILEERSKKPFESLREIGERVKGIKDVKKILIERIMNELSGKENTRLFT